MKKNNEILNLKTKILINNFRITNDNSWEKLPRRVLPPIKGSFLPRENIVCFAEFIMKKFIKISHYCLLLMLTKKEFVQHEINHR